MSLPAAPQLPLCRGSGDRSEVVRPLWMGCGRFAHLLSPHFQLLADQNLQLIDPFCKVAAETRE